MITFTIAVGALFSMIFVIAPALTRAAITRAERHEDELEDLEALREREQARALLDEHLARFPKSLPSWAWGDADRAEYVAASLTTEGRAAWVERYGVLHERNEQALEELTTFDQLLARGHRR